MDACLFSVRASVHAKKASPQPSRRHAPRFRAWGRQIAARARRPGLRTDARPARTHGLALRAHVSRLVPDAKPPPLPVHDSGSQRVARDAMAWSAYGGGVPCTLRAFRPPLSRALRIE